jgi:hypothetical protein
MEAFKIAVDDVYGQPPLAKGTLQHLDAAYAKRAETGRRAATEQGRCPIGGDAQQGAWPTAGRTMIARGLTAPGDVAHAGASNGARYCRYPCQVPLLGFSREARTARRLNRSGGCIAGT